METIKINLTDREYFKLACFAEDLQLFYQEFVKAKRDRIQLFDVKEDGSFQHKTWVPAKVCSHSGEALTKENIDIRSGYWTPNLWRPIKKEYLIEAKRIDTYECQKIDSNCNDCAFFSRVSGDKGNCDKFSKTIIVNPNHCQPENSGCFIHRLDKINIVA